MTNCLMTNALSITNLNYSVSGVEMLNALHLQIPEASYFAIAGVNGVGNSTLIKLILDLIRPSSVGELKIFGQPNRETLFLRKVRIGVHCDQGR